MELRYDHLQHGLIAVLFSLILTCFSSLTVYAETEAPALIQVGDQLQISFLGEEGFEDSFEVDRQGFIRLPEIGLIKVSGLNLTDLNNLIRQQLAQSYRNTERVEVSLKASRLLVTVLGYVQTPGEVNIPGQGNLQMALTAAGGLKPGAQLDRIQIKRAGQVQVVDFKQYMDSGDETLIPSLQPLDIIFVPSSPLTGNVQVEFDAASLLAGGDAAEKKQSVRIFGEVHHPGTFSFEEGQNMVDLLMRAGGVTRFASVSQIRLITEGEPQLFDLKGYLDTGSSKSMPAVAAGATIFVPMKEEEIKTGNSTIYIMGEVFRPGAYETKADASFFDILANAGGPTRYARSREIRIIRRNGTVVNFDLQAYTEGLNTQNVPQIAAGDAIFIPEKNDLNQTSWLKISPDRAVHVLGAITNPGRYEWSDEMSLLDLLAESSGPTKDADLAQLSIKRKGQPPVTFNLQAYLSGRNKSPLPQLKGGDTVIIPRQPELPEGNKAAWVKQSSEESIFVLGQVGVPGRYRFSPELSFLDVLAAANGPSQQADLREVRVIHRNHSAVQLTQIDLALYFETGDQSLLPELKAGDTIFIPDQVLTNYPNQGHKSVRIMGALNSPGYYRFNDDMNLLDLLALAGGPTSEALTEDLHIVHQGCCDTRTTHFDLRAYLKDPQAHLLPVVRAGDTVFMPVRSQSRWSESMALVRDLVSILTLLLLL